MQVRTLTELTAANGGLRSFAVVFDAGEEPISGLERVARDEGIDGAQLTAIGAFREATVGWFDLDTRDYRRIEVHDQVELLSLVGDVTLAGQAGDERRIHAHVVLGRSTGETVWGSPARGACPTDARGDRHRVADHASAAATTRRRGWR